MTDTPTSSAHTPRMDAVGFKARLSGLVPLLLVPCLIAAGLLAMAMQAALLPDQRLIPAVFEAGFWRAVPVAFSGVLASWATLTLAGLAMGMMIFLMASGLTLVFGLMDVVNFGHGAFISVGAFVGVSVMAALSAWTGAPSLALNLAAIGLAAIAAMFATATMGLVFERVVVRPVYRAHLKQILVTVGGLIIVEQLIQVLWGPDEIFLSRPETLKGAIVFHGVALETYRLLAVAVGLVVLGLLAGVLRWTKIGLIVRAGVENGEMVEALGYRLQRVFILVFVAGSALAGLGGILWAMYQETITATMGGELMVMVFIVIIIGGLGSVEGCFIGALLVGLTQNYTAFLEPKLALVSSIGLMVVILMWRPQGMMPAVKDR